MNEVFSWALAVMYPDGDGLSSKGKMKIVVVSPIVLLVHQQSRSGVRGQYFADAPIKEAIGDSTECW